MESDRNIFILGIVLIFLGIGSYVIQLHMELRRVRAASAVRFCEYTLTNEPVFESKRTQYVVRHLGTIR